MSVFKRFRTNQSGTTAVLFGLSVMPLMLAVGGAVDYSRAASVQTELQRAVDAVAVRLVREPATTSAGDLNALAQKMFSSVYGLPSYVTGGPVTATRTGASVAVHSTASVRNAFMQIVGRRETTVAANATSAWGTQKIELALVLDNTGSMADSIGGQRKIDALKASAQRLLSDLRGVATASDTVKVSVVPFDTEVHLDAATYRNADWIRWTNPNSQLERNTWTGYVIDRYSPYDTSDASPAMSVQPSLYPKLQASQWAAYGDLAKVQPLTSLYDSASYQAVSATIAAMKPRGNTNVGLGVSWGTATLTGSVPLSTSSPAGGTADVKRFMVILTDGTNTQKWVNGVPMAVLNPDNPSSTDPVTVLMNASTSQACNTAKNVPGGGIEVFTIRLLDGDTNLLKGCASDADHYFDVQNADQLSSAFLKITGAISGTRLTM